jgi:3-oxoadipate enol-lactonase
MSSSYRTGDLARQVSGMDAGRPLIMVHSLGVDSTMWTLQLEELSKIRRVLTVDLPGHGNSSATPGPYSIEDLGRDVLDVATDAGMSRFELCGISLGGLIGLWLAIHAPDRVLSLVVANTAARIGSADFWQDRIRAVEQGGMAVIRDQVVARFFTPEFAERDPETVARINRIFAGTDPVGYVACCAALRDDDLRSSVPSIRCPTLIVVGKADSATPPADSVWLSERIPESRLRILPEAAHLSNLEQPAAFTATVSDFLAPPPS